MPRRVFNWSRTQHCTPIAVAEPDSESELLELVREARATGRTVKVMGARHSWSDIAMSEGVLISLDRMQRVLEVDPEGLRVTVEAGIRLNRLNEELAARGLALPILGSVTEQSLAGVMSTGTHGSSLVHGNIPSHALALRLITGRSEILELDADHPLLPAARVGLGALGIITQVTLRVDRAFSLCETSEVIEFDEAVERLDELARSAEYVKLWWLPHTRGVIVFRCDRTRELGQVSRFGRWLDEWVINKLVFRFVLFLGRLAPRIIPAANRLVARTYLEPRRVVGRSDHVLSLAMPPRHRETEYAVPVSHSGEALRRTRALIEELGVRVNFITELRFVRGDEGWLSPASGRDSCQLGAYMAQAEGIERYFRGFEERMRELGGRPHWGKEFHATPDELREMYPQLNAFVAAVREHDPDGVFRNRFLDRVMPR